jgi:hypothetical protein
MARFAPGAYELCDWCGKRREISSCSDWDDRDRYSAGWRHVPEGDLCRLCVTERAQAIEDARTRRIVSLTLSNAD